MATNPNVQRMASNIGFPDLRISEFTIPPLPNDVTRRFPSLEIWRAQVQEEHNQWRGNLQRALEEALQSLKP